MRHQRLKVRLLIGPNGSSMELCSKIQSYITSYILIIIVMDRSPLECWRINSFANEWSKMMGSEYNVGILILGSINSQRQYESQDHFLILLEIGIDENRRFWTQNPPFWQNLLLMKNKWCIIFNTASVKNFMMSFQKYNNFLLVW